MHSWFHELVQYAVTNGDTADIAVGVLSSQVMAPPVPVDEVKTPKCLV